MKFLILDAEQHSILEHQLRATLGFFRARHERVGSQDPENKGLGLQARKVEQMLHQCANNIQPRWDNIPTGLQNEVIRFATVLSSAKEASVKASAFRALRTSILDCSLATTVLENDVTDLRSAGVPSDASTDPES